MDAMLLKVVSRGREVQEKREAEQRKALLVLILRHLADHGYLDAVDRLSTEANVYLAKCDAADNISLLHILQDYEDEHEQRYGRRPKLFKQLLPSEVPTGVGGFRHAAPKQPSQHNMGTSSTALCPTPPISGRLAAHQRREQAAATSMQPVPTALGHASSQRHLKQQQNSNHSKLNSKQEQQVAAGDVSCSSSSSTATSSRQQSADGSAPPALEVSGQGCDVSGSTNKGHQQQRSKASSLDASDEDTDNWATRLLKPLPSSLLGELRQLGAAISQDIYQESPNVKWADIAGLADAKRLLQESVGLPMKYPELFTGLLAPWRGVLLYGPPGTGKTLLAKAVATSCRTTFFNISASSIVSKWRGDSEKLVRVLFDLARHHAPATIFLDEVDALMGARGAEGEHEASRRMKTELLIQMDGLTHSSATTDNGSSSGAGQQQPEPQVFVLAASNLPWDLDQALLRRLQKRILVPLPDTEARHSMLQRLLASRLGPGVDLDQLVAATEGYSGSDITLLAKEAAMRPLRRLLAVLEPGVYDSAAAAADAGAAGATEAAGHLLDLGPVTSQDLSAALSVTKPSAQGCERQYADFSSKLGQAG